MAPIRWRLPRGRPGLDRPGIVGRLPRLRQGLLRQNGRPTDRPEHQPGDPGGQHAIRANPRRGVWADGPGKGPRSDGQIRRRPSGNRKPLRYTRTTINSTCESIKRIFKWAVRKQLIPETVYRRLLTVPGLKQGRTQPGAGPDPPGGKQSDRSHAPLPLARGGRYGPLPAVDRLPAW